MVAVAANPNISSRSGYVIAELRPDERAGFAPRGAAAELWRYQGPEVCISGPAETGKTWAALQKLDALLWKYPEATAAIIRKTYQSMHGSVLQTYRRVLGKDTPVEPYGGERPQWYDYPNGSRAYVGGMDNPDKVLSSERDFLYINQGEELEIADYETLRTRNTGRGGGAPYPQTIVDVNPGPPNHWILKREKAGHLKMLYSRHEDNPTLYDDRGKITEQGKRTMMVLDSLTGVRHKRLRLGLWVAAEGQVYEGWDPSIHMIDHVPGHAEWTKNSLPSGWRRFRDIDFGFTNPFVCHWWAMDDDGRLYCYREIYKTQTLVEDAAVDINRLSEGETIELTISDHDAEDRATLERRGIWTFPADKEVSPGIQALAGRLRKAGDGRPRIYFFRDILAHEPDQSLLESRKPTCTTEEFEGYVWATTPSGQPGKERPVKQDDHGLDGTRYLVYHLDGMPDPVRYERGFDD